MVEPTKDLQRLFGRQATILSRRERIKQATLKRRKRMNRRAA
jgi:hypothetical protein